MRIKILSYILAVLYFGAIIFICLFPFSHSIRIPHYIFNIPVDKMVHFLMFLPYFFVLWMILDFREDKKKYGYLFIIITGVIFAGLTELAQRYLTIYRNGDIFDFFADIAGLITGMVIVLLIEYRSKKIIKNEKSSNNILYDENQK